MQILEDFRNVNEYYTKKYKNQKLFKSMRMTRGASGEMEPVFYIGVPGVSVAVSFAVVIVATFVLVSLPFKWYFWALFIIATVLGLRVALKLDKVRQIRYMVHYLLDTSLKLMEKAESEKDTEKKKQYLSKAEEWLDKAHTYVDEPAINAQLDLLKNS